MKIQANIDQEVSQIEEEDYAKHHIDLEKKIFKPFDLREANN